MTAASTPPSRRSDERGQSTLEYVGIAVVAALLVIAVVGAVDPGGIRSAVSCHIGNVVAGTSGSCATGAGGANDAGTTAEAAAGEGAAGGDAAGDDSPGATGPTPSWPDPDGPDSDRDDTARDAREDRRDDARGERDGTAEESSGTDDPGPPAPDDPLGDPVPGTSVDEPAATEWRPVDDGAGEHGSEGAGVQDRIADTAAEVAANGLSRTWPDAARNLLHFLGNSGDPLEQDVDKILADLPEFDQAVTTWQDDLGLGAVERARAAGATGPVTFPVRTAWRGFGYTETGALAYDDRNWFYALGGWQYSLTGQVTVYPPSTPGGEWRYETTTRTHLRDQYNWDGGKATQIGPLTITDEQLAELHRKGLAQEFTAYGVSGRATREGEVP